MAVKCGTLWQKAFELKVIVIVEHVLEPGDRIAMMRKSFFQGMPCFMIFGLIDCSRLIDEQGVDLK